MKIYLKFFNIYFLSCRFLSTKIVTGILQLYSAHPHLIGSKRIKHFDLHLTVHLCPKKVSTKTKYI